MTEYLKLLTQQLLVMNGLFLVFTAVLEAPLQRRAALHLLGIALYSFALKKEVAPGWISLLK